MEAKMGATDFYQRFEAVVQGDAPRSDYERALSAFVQLNGLHLTTIGAPRDTPEWRAEAYAYIIYAPQSVESPEYRALRRFDELADEVQPLSGHGLTSLVYWLALHGLGWPYSLRPLFESIVGTAIRRGWNVCREPHRDFSELLDISFYFTSGFAQTLFDHLRWCLSRDSTFYEAFRNSLLNESRSLPASTNDIRKRQRKNVALILGWKNALRQTGPVEGYDRYDPSGKHEFARFDTPRELNAGERAEQKKIADTSIALALSDLRKLEQRMREAQEREQVFDLVLRNLTDLVLSEPLAMQHHQMQRELSIQPPRGSYPGGPKFQETRQGFPGRDTVKRLEELTYETRIEEIEQLLRDLDIGEEFDDVIDAVNYLKEYLSQL